MIARARAALAWPAGAAGRLRGGELIACAVCLSAVAAVMCAAHVSHGGLYYDDWGVLALARAHPHGGLLHALWLNYGQRPGQVLYYAALDGLLGAHASARLALAAGALVLECTCLYALLRRVGLAVGEAGAIALLALTFPFSDSVWLWGIMSLASLAIAAALLGVLLALRALESRGRRAFALHGASLALYVLSLLSYELFAVAGCLAGLLYTRAVGLRRARTRWVLDVLVICATVLTARALLPVDIATPSHAQSLSGMAGHAALIARDGAGLLGAAILPLAGVPTLAGCAALVLVLAASAVLRRRARPAAAARAELNRLLALAAVGSLAALGAWAVYVPAGDHYSPMAGGTVNRVNVAAALGIAIALYALLALLARVLGRALRLPGSASVPLTAALVLALAFAYLERSAADRRVWDAAAFAQRRELTELRPLIAGLRAGATVFATGAPRELPPGVPVLGTALDLESALRINFARAPRAAVPLTGTAGADCAAGGPRAGNVRGGYGSSYLVELALRRVTRLAGRAQCAAVLDQTRRRVALPAVLARAGGSGEG